MLTKPRYLLSLSKKIGFFYNSENNDNDDNDKDYSDNHANNHNYYIHFEITGGPCYLIGSNWCDLFTNRTIFCSKSHLFSSQ